MIVSNKSTCVAEESVFTAAGPATIRKMPMEFGQPLRRLTSDFKNGVGGEKQIVQGREQATELKSLRL